jgi:RNA-directed DNA polymerase
MNKPMEETYRMKVSEMQRKLAQKATRDAEHRFTNLYDLLTWQPLMEWAFDKLMTKRGSRTAGIDGMDKRTAIENREKILSDLRTELKTNTYRHQPVKRGYVPKKDGSRRPLGIPTLTDRLVQMMVKAILEPIFESDFFPCSHGYRPGLSCHTAMAHLHLMTAPRQKKMHWVIEGDIAGCFEHVQHKILVRLIQRRVQDKKLMVLIWQMLRAGVMEGELFKKTEEGTPQGGVVSPLYANIYLHELDQWFHENYTGLNYNEKNRRRRKKIGNAFYLRYADDFVVAWNGTKEGAIQLKIEIGCFLKDHLGLDLSETKTRVTHVTEGYDFLSFTVKRVIDEKRGYNELVFYPSKASVMKLKRRIKEMTKRGTTLPSVRDKIKALNYLLVGWSNFYRHSCASRTFSYVGHYAFRRMEGWLMKKTGQRVRKVYRKYYRRHNGYLTWVSGGIGLFHPGVLTKIRYVRYKHRPNPYLVDDEVELPYHLSPFPGNRDWTGDHRYGEEWTEVREQVVKRDNYQCQICGNNGRVEVHHIRKHKPNQENNPSLLITLCASCHRKARNQGSEEYRQLARIHPEAGEPEALKGAHPVREEE